MIFYIVLVLLSVLAGLLIEGQALTFSGNPLSRPAAVALFGGIALVGIVLARLLSRVSRRKLFFFFLALGTGKLLSFLVRLILVTYALRPGTGLTGQPALFIAVFDIFFIAGSVIYFLHFESTLGRFRIADIPLIAAGRASESPVSGYKILDTSVIIDGRIADIVETGFLDGVLVVPQFVLLELQQIADSADSIKRGRGRRGLDILNRMKRSDSCVIKITDTDFPDIAEVDTKLIELCKKIGGVVITNDFNLNKVAELRGVRVLNINQLTNALKPSVLPGEEMDVSIVKEGKDPNQGIAYLEDGTMIVVDNGRRHINRRLRVAVTSVIQTPAGRMIFTEPAG